jgi:uncharacterized membrane protein YoaK (UPF0700 family)
MEQSHNLSLEARWRAYREPALLAAMAGFVDTLGFVALYGLFTAHVTGNLVVAGAEMAGGNVDVLAKLLAIPTFVLAVGAITWWVQHSAARDARLLAKIMLVEAFWLTAFMLAGLVLGPLRGADGWDTIVTGMLGVIAMSVRNAAGRLLLGTTTPSTIMTGNVTQLTIDTTTLLSGKDDPAAARGRIKKILPAVLGFTAGAALGAGGYAAFGFASLGLPIAATLWLALREWAASRQRGAKINAEIV